MAPSDQPDLFGGLPPRVLPVPPTEAHRLAEGLPSRLRMGTSSWAYAGWAGIVYRDALPEALLAREGLAAYAAHPLLRTVCVDRGWYAPLPTTAWAELAAQAPEDFRFLVKAPMDCTIGRFPAHRRYGVRAGQDNERFLEPGWATEQVVGPAMEGLGERLGPILFLFQPRDPGGYGGPLAFAERLGRFLEALPRGPVYAVEVRDRHLLTRDYADALRSAGAVHTIVGYPGMPGFATQGRVAEAASGPALVVRWMLRHDLTFDQARARYLPFTRIVDPDRGSREAIATLVHAAEAAGRPSWVIASNRVEGSAPLSLTLLAEALHRPPDAHPRR